jgi:hypothetical protein
VLWLARSDGRGDVLVVVLGRLNYLNGFDVLAAKEFLIRPCRAAHAIGLQPHVDAESARPEAHDHCVIEISDFDAQFAGRGARTRSDGAERLLRESVSDGSAHDLRQIAIDRQVRAHASNAARTQCLSRSLVDHI